MTSLNERPAFYALAPGGWRDYLTLLHPPYTAWHLSYVAIGAAVAPAFDGGRLGATALAFFLAVGLTAHALDELAGRPLATSIPDTALRWIAAGGLVGAVALGLAGAVIVSWWLVAFVAVGVFIVLAYNLELFGGAFHSDVWFAAAWGAFPALTSSFTQAETIRWEAVLVALACGFLSAAQRRLSTPVRRLRRHVVQVEGRMIMKTGAEVEIDERELRQPSESALRALTVAMILLSGGLVAARMLNG